MESSLLKEQFKTVQYILKWALISIPVSLFVGTGVALFLWLLKNATIIHQTHPWLLFLLPIAGILIYILYKHLGKNSEAGNNLIMDEIHEPGGGIPLRMAPLVLLTTVLTHLFGGSAGREGTAVQIGGSIAGKLGKWLKLGEESIKTILQMGIAAGFGAVFGTPITGAIFALEVLALGRIKYNALLPCLLASIMADIVCTTWGIGHTQYHITFDDISRDTTVFMHFNPLLLLKVAVAGVCFGLASMFFSELSHFIKSTSSKFIKTEWLTPLIGGAIIIILAFTVGKDYLGLGVSNKDPDLVTITTAFFEGGADTFSWLWKLLFTAITLSMGFKGGEVTPLFFIGATLGNTLAVLMGAPVDLFAGIGFIAVFAGATNTPIACTIMGIELFGGEYTLYYATACFFAYYFSAHTGIYSSQIIAVSKLNSPEKNKTLSEVRKRRVKDKQ